MFSTLAGCIVNVSSVNGLRSVSVMLQIENMQCEQAVLISGKIGIVIL